MPIVRQSLQKKVLSRTWQDAASDWKTTPTVKLRELDYSWWLQYLDIWLVVYLPLWKIWKSVGIIIPNIWKNKIHVPNHQPDIHGDTWIIYSTYVAGLRDDPEPGTWSSKNSHESGHQLQPKPPFFTPKQEIYRWWMLVTYPIISQYSSSDIPVNSTKCTHPLLMIKALY